MAVTGNTIAEMVVFELPSFAASDGSQIEYFTKKWQIHLAEIIDPNITDGNTFVEAAWPELANMLIAELVCYSIIMASLRTAMANVSSNGTSTENPGQADSAIKHIVEGPAEVEWFDPAKSQSDAAKAFFSKTGSGTSAFDEIKISICQKASRLNIGLYICKDLAKTNQLISKDRVGGNNQVIVVR